MSAHRDTETLVAGLDHVRAAPADGGVVELVVRRPAEDEREVLDEGALDLEVGLVGDCWADDDEPNPDAQLTLMNARAAELVAGGRERWPLAGDQLYVDLDLSESNLPVGTRLRVGEAEVEITAEPHLGCSKFRARFGTDALVLVNRPDGRALRLRGVNARVVAAGRVRPGDAIAKLAGASVAASAAGEAPAALEGTAWQVVSPSGTTATLAFAEGRAFGSAGVNRYSGSAELDGERLAFGPLAVTRMAGLPEAMADEDAFLAALSAVTGWAIEDARLQLRDAEGAVRLTLELAPAAASDSAPI